MMRFFTQVCFTDKYEEQMSLILNKLSHRYDSYVEGVVEIALLLVERVPPLVFIGVTR